MVIPGYLAGSKCPAFFRVSGLAVPRKTRRKPNDLIGSTPKPDRITADQRGVEPVELGTFKTPAFGSGPCQGNRVECRLSQR